MGRPCGWICSKFRVSIIDATVSKNYISPTIHLQDIGRNQRDFFFHVNTNPKDALATPQTSFLSQQHGLQLKRFVNMQRNIQPERIPYLV